MPKGKSKGKHPICFFSAEGRLKEEYEMFNLNTCSNIMSQSSILSIIKNKIYGMLFTMGCVLGLGLYMILGKPNIIIDASYRLLIIPKGCSLKKLATHLQQEGYIKHPITFLWTAYLLRYNPQRTPGQYRLMPHMNNWQIVKMLRGAMQYPVKVTFSSGINKETLVKQLTHRIGLQDKTLLDMLNNPTKVAAYGFSTENILTMFIPDTYEMYWTITAEQLLAKIHLHYQRFWNQTRMKQANKIKLTPISIAILASIVQSETNDLSEAPIIAGVYLNRIKRNMRIESDPVLIYALKDKVLNIKRVLQQDIYINSPYNSYRNKGLPPGPITLPNIAMIDAVLNYVNHNYLFFSAKENFSGLHYFTSTYTEHLRNANKYRRALNARKMMR